VGIEIVDAGCVFARAWRNGGDKLAAVIVDAQKIERSAADLHVAGLDAHEVERIFAGEGFGIFAVESGVDEPDVAKSVRAIGSLAIGISRGGGLAVGHAESGANLKLGVDSFDGAKGLALSDVDDVRGAHALGEIAARGSMNAPRIAEKGEDPRFVEETPVRDAVAECANGKVGVIAEARGEIAIGPAAGPFQFLREIPVIERAEWTDFCFEECVGEAFVVIEAFRIGRTSAIGLDARPGDRKTVAVEV